MQQDLKHPNSWPSTGRFQERIRAWF